MNYQFCIKFLLNYFKIVAYLVFIVFVCFKKNKKKLFKKKIYYLILNLEKKIIVIKNKFFFILKLKLQKFLKNYLNIKIILIYLTIKNKNKILFIRNT